MSTQRIPESYTNTCDRCGHKTEPHWSKHAHCNGWSKVDLPHELTPNRDSFAPMDLCPDCTKVVAAVVLDRAGRGAA